MSDTTTQPVALRLAAMLDEGNCGLAVTLIPSAAELRRQHAEIERLKDETEGQKSDIKDLTNQRHQARVEIATAQADLARVKRELICALEREKVAKEVKTETGWLVENGKQGDQLRYRTWKDGMSDWTVDHNEATRYCRRIDAERAHQEDEDAASIVEHMWHTGDLDAAINQLKGGGICNDERCCSACYSGQGECETLPSEIQRNKGAS